MYHKQPIPRNTITMLEIIMGCMFSGKSTEVIRRIKRLKTLKKKVMVINHSIDTRYTDGNQGFIATHNRESEPCISADKLSSLIETPTFKDADVIIVEEAQFFPDLFDFTTRALDVHGKHVIISGLDGDSNRKPFGDILRLIPHAEHVSKLSALCLECNDGTEAFFSKKLVASPSNSDSQICVGAADKYIAVCRKHFNSTI